MWKSYGISQCPWRKRSFSAKPLAWFPWEMAVCFPPAPRDAQRGHGQLCSLLWLARGGFGERHFWSSPPRSCGATASCQRVWEPQNISIVWWTQMAAQLRVGRGKWCFWNIWLVLSYHSELGDLKRRIIAAPGQFSVGGLCKNTKDPLVPSLEPRAPAWVPILLPPCCGRGRLCSSLPALDWTYLIQRVIILF